MSNNPNDISQWIQELISRSANDQLHNLQRFEEMLRRAGRGDVDSNLLREEYLRFAREESLRYISDLTRVGLSFYNTLLELNRNYNDRFFQHAFGADRSQGMPNGAEKSGPRVVAMDLHAPLGAEAIQSFVIENQRTEPVSVSFLVSEFSNEAGDASFRPPLLLTPARFAMRPAEERRVTLQIPLLPEFFVIGQIYTATIIVSGFENLHLRLRVWADSVQDTTGDSPAEYTIHVDAAPVFKPVEEIQPDNPPDEADPGIS